MNAAEYSQNLNLLVNDASRDLAANVLVAGLVNHLASVLAVSAVQTGIKPEEVLEVARHELDIMMTRYMQEYARNSSR